MIRVTLELIPGGVGRPEHLGTIEISNQVSLTLADHRRGDYEYEFFKKRRKVAWAQGLIENFPRRAYHPWDLVRLILNEVAERNGGHI